MLNDTFPMQHYGLLGKRLIHSFSARYFAAKFKQLGLAAVYENFEYADIDSAVEGLRRQENLSGFNVTIPYKEQIIPYLQGLSDDARTIGAVNVVEMRQSQQGDVAWWGHNSDWVGFMQSLQPLLQKDCTYQALVLGTGGASKAVAYALQQLGIAYTFVSRTPQGAHCLAYADVDDATLRSHSLIINTTPLGMYPHVDSCPNIPYEALTPAHVLYDLVYNPATTRFMQRGIDQGCIVTNGADMLRIQAERAWLIWNGAE